MNPSPSLRETILGVFLHDIGKFAQRAGWRDGRFSPAAERLLQNILPQSPGGRFTHWHALYTAEFFEWMEEEGLAFPGGLSRERVRAVAVHHHNPSESEPLEWLCAEADRLSSGMERKAKDEAFEAETGGRDAYIRTALESPFSRIHIYKDRPPRRSEVPLAPLAPGPDAIPREHADTGAYPELYRQLWHAFLTELTDALRGENLDVFEEALLSLSARYLHAIPSSTKDQPDISLHDHARAAAAVAAAMYRWHEENGSLGDPSKIRDREIPKFRMLAGDLSGIQDTLFQLAHQGVKGVNRILRARSFYMSLLVEAGALEARGVFGLPAFSVLQAAGGRFLLLVPDLSDAESRVESLRSRIEPWMYQRWRGQLTLNLALSAPFSGRGLTEGNYGGLMRELAACVENEKLRAFRTCVAGNAVHGDADYSKGWVCQACGARPGAERERDEEGQPVYRCTPCEEEHRLGSVLPRAVSIRWGGDRGECSLALWDGLALHLDTRRPHSLTGVISGWELWRHDENGRAVPEMGLRFAANYVPRLTREDLDRPVYRDLSEEARQLQPGDLKLFEQIAVDDVKEDGGKLRGVRRLGVLKADVDSLGLLLQLGLGERISLSRVAALSRMLDFFFTGHLNWLLAREFPSTYTVYAGGDDLLLIGPWRQTLQLALRLRREFGQWVGHNPNITISAGVELIKDNEPLNRSVAAAEARLERAKGRTGADRRTVKDGICAVDARPQGWEEFALQLERAERLRQYLAAGKVSQALIYRLLGFDEDRLEVELASRQETPLRPVEIEKAAWRARWGHQLVRNVLSGRNLPPEQRREREEIAAFLNELLGLTADLRRRPDPAPPARTAVAVALYSHRSFEGKER